MSVSARSLLVPGIALATVGVLALGPTAAAPPAVTLAQPTAQVPAVQVDAIQLAGIGRDIYDSITTFVQYTVSSAEFWISLVPVVGPPIAEQVGINYFGLIQPVIANTVYVISDIIANPLNLIGYTVTYFSQLGYIGYNWASDQAQFFGLPAFPPIPAPPPLASVPAPGAGGRAAATVAEPVATAAPAEAATVAVVEAPAAEVAPAAKITAVRVGRDAARPEANSVPHAAAATADEGSAAADDGARGSAQTRAARGGDAAR